MLGLERRLPVAVDDSLHKTMRDDCGLPTDRRPLYFPAVHADTVVHLFERVCVGIDGRLPPRANRFCLPPVLLLSDALSEKPCSVGVHGLRGLAPVVLVAPADLKFEPPCEFGNQDDSVHHTRAPISAQIG